MRYRTFNYLRSNCGLGCKTTWLKCGCASRKTIVAPFIGNLIKLHHLHMSNIIYICATLFMMSSKSCDPNDVIFGTKYMEFPMTLGFIRTFVTYPYPNS